MEMFLQAFVIVTYIAVLKAEVLDMCSITLLS